MFETIITQLFTGIYLLALSMKKEIDAKEASRLFDIEIERLTNKYNTDLSSHFKVIPRLYRYEGRFKLCYCDNELTDEVEAEINNAFIACYTWPFNLVSKHLCDASDETE